MVISTKFMRRESKLNKQNRGYVLIEYFSRKFNEMTYDDLKKYISVDPEIMHGSPCVKGTRIPVWLVVSMLADGMSEKQILKEYPSLTKTTIKASLKYAAKMSDFKTMTL